MSLARLAMILATCALVTILTLAGLQYAVYSAEYVSSQYAPTPISYYSLVLISSALDVLIPTAATLVLTQFAQRRQWARFWPTLVVVAVLLLGSPLVLIGFTVFANGSFSSGPLDGASERATLVMRQVLFQYAPPALAALVILVCSVWGARDGERTTFAQLNDATLEVSIEPMGD